jgi:hypothetical protein
MTPSQLHWHIESDVSADRPPTVTVGEPGDHGPVTTGTHGTGDPWAAITCGFVGAVHMPNVAITIGEKSWTVATVWLTPFTMFGTSEIVAVPGGWANEHFAEAPMTTSCAILGPRTAGFAGSECPPAGERPQDALVRSPCPIGHAVRPLS